MHGWLDVHAHFVTPRYVEECHRAGITEPDGMPRLPSWNMEAALDLMEQTGVAAAVLSISSPGVHFGADATAADPAARSLAAHVNDFGAEVVAQHPSRFGLSAELPLPDIDGALNEITRAYDDLGADAIALKTNFHGRYLGDSAFAPVLAELDRRNAVVTLHPTSPACWQDVALGRPRPMLEFIFDTTRCVVDLALGGVLDRHPDIRWIIPHAGAALSIVAHRVEAFSSITAASVDVPAALRSLYYDLAGTPVPVGLDALLAVAGPGQLMYGSDFPFTPASLAKSLAQTLAQAPALAAANLCLTPTSAGGRLFPRLAELSAD